MSGKGIPKKGWSGRKEWGIVFRLEKNEEESGCRNDDSTENGREYNSGERRDNIKSGRMGCRNKLFCPSPLPGHDLVSHIYIYIYIYHGHMCVYCVDASIRATK